MGMNGAGNYNDMARMAMSHPAFLDHQGDRPQVVFGSHSQFEVSLCCTLFLYSAQNIKRQMSIKRRISTELETSSIMGRKDIFYSGSFYNIPEFK